MRARRWTAPAPATRCCPAELRLDNGDSAYVSPGSTLYATDGPRAHRTRPGRRHRRRRRGGAAAPGRGPVPRAACARRGSSWASTRPPPCAACSPPVPGSSRLVGPAGTGKSFVVGAIARGWTDPDATATATAGAAAGVRAGDLADRHRRPHRRRPDRPQRRPLAGHPGPARRRPRRRAGRSRSRATRRGGCTPGTWSWSTSPP